MSDTQEKNAAGAAEATEESEAAEAGPRTTVERVGACECLIRIEADADYLRDRYQEALETLQAEVKLQGFRQGNAPIGLVEKRMGSTVRSDVISSVVSEAYDEAVEENELTVVTEVEAPDLEDFAWEPGQPAEFEFKLEVLPEVELEDDDYKGLAVDVPALEANDELMAGEMERFAQQFATWEQVEGAGIDWDDYVEAEVGVADSDWQETIGFYPRSERIGPFAAEGIKAALVGAKVGDEVELEAEVAEDALARRPELEGMAGDKLTLKLLVTQAARRKVPEVNDELATKMGLSSVKDIEDMVRERLGAAVTRQKDEAGRHALIDGLLEKVACDLPAGLIERAAEREQLRALVRMLRSGVPRQDAERLAAGSAGSTREAVERRLKADLLLRKIAERERIVVTESEVDGQIRTFASRQGWREERARTYMEERGMLRALRDDMRESKAMDFLIENAQLTEVSPEEYAKRHGAAEEAAAEQD